MTNELLDVPATTVVYDVLADLPRVFDPLADPGQLRDLREAISCLAKDHLSFMLLGCLHGFGHAFLIIDHLVHRFRGP